MHQIGVLAILASMMTQLMYCVQVMFYYKYILLACNSNCKTCITSSIKCVLCNDNSHRIVDPLSFACLCDIGFYSNGPDICSACSIKCKTCQLGATLCTDCWPSSHRTITGSNCPCDDGFFDNGSGIKDCVAC